MTITDIMAKLRDGESVGEYVKRLEDRVRELEPPEGFTIQEWHVAQVFAYLAWPDDTRSREERDALLLAYRKRFPEVVEKFATYMGWPLRKSEEK